MHIRIPAMLVATYVVACLLGSTTAMAQSAPSEFRLAMAVPIVGETKVTVTFNWQPSVGAKSYVVRIYSDEACSKLTQEFKSSANCAVTDKLAGPQAYYWRVEAVGDGDRRTPSLGDAKSVWVPRIVAKVVKVTLPKGTAQIDGVAAPGEWDKSVRLELANYISGKPGKEAPPECRIMWDKDAIYILCKATVPDGRSANAAILDRDAGVWLSDGFEIFLVPPGRSTIFQYIISASDSVFDSRGGDVGWNGAFMHSAKSDGPNILIELAFPFTDFGEVPAVGDAWRGNFCSDMAAQTTVSSWQNIKGGMLNNPDYFGTIVLGE